MKIVAVLLMITTAAGAADAPIIWGDGVHDDTAGFEALVCKELFRFRNVPAPGALTITKREGRQIIDMSNRTYMLPSGVPIAKDAPEMAHLPLGTPTYDIDCAARHRPVS